MEPEHPPIIMWFRRDLRFSDHPALHHATASGRPILPLYILDDQVDALGAAPKWRLELGLEGFGEALKDLGSRLTLRRGPALDVLLQLIKETGATSVFWTRAYDPGSIERDTRIKAELTRQGIEARSFAGHLLFEPWDVATKSGHPFRVFTPMWRAVSNRDISTPAAAPSALTPPTVWPLSDHLSQWRLGYAMHRGAAVVQPYVQSGEAAALARLDGFLSRIGNYAGDRDTLDKDGTSDLSEYLSLGEIGPRTIWHRVQTAAALGATGTDAYLRQLVWREFAYHLMYHTPHMLTDNWRPEWEGFPWSDDATTETAQAWIQARTGIPVVDAGLRQMYVTGRMHNRARMIVASYLTKHMLVHWKVGMNWFADCLIDWDPAANAMGWQWVAGSGPDAAPFFRIFNPETQRERFDPNGDYVRRWIAELQPNPCAEALAYFDAVPQSWAVSPDTPYPEPIVSLRDGRAHALAAYESRKSPVRN
ncbi:deoxyribodipyrimidine photolyase [Ruegeria sp. ANG-S4]|uniref:cryptochrome/photolyase family protein n=1 Tax=Ruegeria sp. ANG-S4 TaxID=1577904 RepID=UPI00057E45BA|nr:deoxyribodipyrimidine photo-lyase [Ruegeria sp. ANG-S4]KIC44242.1 deoxyribodipyrimidine photolyase [Ruegeria sp. ANG-S4]